MVETAQFSLTLFSGSEERESLHVCKVENLRLHEVRKVHNDLLLKEFQESQITGALRNLLSVIHLLNDLFPDLSPIN